MDFEIENRTFEKWIFVLVLATILTPWFPGES